jgi:hypothetical protein
VDGIKVDLREMSGGGGGVDSPNSE